MQPNNWKDVAELLGLAGIVASLIFVGLQMKQSQEIALSAAYQSRADSSLALKSLILESDTLLTGMSKALSGVPQDLTPTENLALRTYIWGELVYLENAHYQYVKGFLSEEQWQSNRGDLKALFSVDYVRILWAENPGSWRESFVSEIERVIVEINEN